MCFPTSEFNLNFGDFLAISHPKTNQIKPRFVFFNNTMQGQLGAITCRKNLHLIAKNTFVCDVLNLGLNNVN